MKNLMIATALATTLATSAFAVNETQIGEIKNFAAGIDVESMTEDELEIAYGVVTSGMSRGDKLAKLRSLAETDGPVVMEVAMAELSETELERLMQYAPDVDFAVVTQAQAEAALAATYSSGSPDDIAQRVMAILTNDATMVGEMNNASRAEMEIIRGYVPEADVMSLSQAELNTALSIAYGGDSPNEKTAKIKAIVDG